MSVTATEYPAGVDVTPTPKLAVTVPTVSMLQLVPEKTRRIPLLIVQGRGETLAGNPPPVIWTRLPIPPMVPYPGGAWLGPARDVRLNCNELSSSTSGEPTAVFANDPIPESPVFGITVIVYSMLATPATPKPVPPVIEPPLIPVQTAGDIRPPGAELREQVVASEAKPTPLTVTNARLWVPIEGVTATRGSTLKLAVPLSTPPPHVTVTV